MPQSISTASRIVRDDLQSDVQYELETPSILQQKNNLSRLRQRFQQVAKANPISQISTKLASGGSNWAHFTSNIRRTLDDSKDSLNDANSEFNANDSADQLVEVNLEVEPCFGDKSTTLDRQFEKHNVIELSHFVRKAESEPDLMNFKNDQPTSLQDSKVSSLSTLTFPMQMRPGSKPILALDLDETLIHSSLVPRRPADFWIEVIQNGDMRTREVFWVYKRPGVDEFLRTVAQFYTVVIFTAGIKEYAAQILDELDPENKIFSGRLYRDSCTESRGLHPSMFSTTAPPSAYTKDMNRICDDMSRTLLVDNTPGCFALQPANGLPIRSWYADPSDKQLARLQQFLCEVQDVNDLRLVLPEWKM